MTETRFQQLVKWGGLALLLAAVGNIFFVLRYREAYRDATRIEQVYPQQLATLNLEQQALEGVIRDFAGKAGTDPRVAEILRRYGLVTAPKP
ncbi:MAG: hypothetical protein WCS70_08810 [Verrucomicrobiota bacterium]